MNAEPLGDHLQLGESSRFNYRVETLLWADEMIL